MYIVVAMFSYVFLGTQFGPVTTTAPHPLGQVVTKGLQGNNSKTCKTIVSPLSPKSDSSQISHCSIKGLSVKVIRTENMITQVKFSRPVLL